jgi:hypothetical protein
MLVLFLALGLAVVAFAATAHAEGTVTRNGSDYSGIRNPGNCEIMPDGAGLTSLHVKCTAKVGATGEAYVRYRFLKDVGGVRDAANVAADITTWVGDDCFAEWMVKMPKTAARTLRVTVPFGSYCHINSVTWSQP